MNDFFNKVRSYVSNHKGLVIIVVAALLLELISAVQYYYSHNMMEAQLSKRAESELRMKSIIIKGMLNVMENTLKEHLWDMERNISHADSMYVAAKRTIMANPKVTGCFLAFMPNYYPEKGRLFEPYAYKDNDSIRIRNLAEKKGVDYPTNPTFIKMLKEEKPFWSDPYEYEDDGVVKPLTTYTYPLYDSQGRLAAVGGIDISLEWLDDTLDYRHIYPSSFILLLTESGQLISRPLSEHVKTQDVDKVVRIINDSTVSRSESQSGISKVIRFKDDKGDRASVFYANMKGLPHWQMAVVCYDDEVYEKLHWMRINMLVLMLIAFGILGYILSRFMLNERKLSLAKEEKQRIGNELRIATGIQSAMLMQDEKVAERPDITISAILKPAREVGGDLYNYFIRDEKLFFCIGDVSGKGIPSALIMAMTQALFRAVSSHESNPAHIMKTINETACSNNKTNMFATLFIGVLDLPTGRLRYCNAGHDAPMLLNGTGVSQLPVIANLPVGLFDDFKYEMQETIINKDDTLFLYTDGLTEARNTDHQQFGMQRITSVLKQVGHDLPENIIHSMTGHVRQFVGEEEQSDDLTMLALRYSPVTNDYTVHGELTMKNDVSQLKDLHAFLKSVAETLGLDASMTRSIRLAVEEAVVNVMDYAYPSGTVGDITLKAMSNNKYLKLSITDSGMAFDPTEAAKADTTLSAEDRPIGGLGILLVREMMDSLNYERIGGKNILTMKKKLS
jgi:sigma-B regulation protein RsbU (phosphoserine phosphatase)